MAVWYTLLLLSGLAILVPMAVWSVECAAALLPARRRRYDAMRRPRLAILVPAHNEAHVIRQTLDNLRRQILAGDWLVVIADNCTDDTARIARDSGTLVFERHDELHQGKSYALDFGLRSLGSDPPEVLVVVDADCQADSGSIDRMARLASATGAPVQANYLLESPDEPKLAELAFLIKNFVRPSGLDRLGLPCFLNGSGMAFPARILQDSILSNGQIAEDKWLTVDLALLGCVPIFCPDARITSNFPNQQGAKVSQATRWLHGHLECIVRQGPRLLAGAMRQRRIDLFGLFLDLCVPPLSLLLASWTVVFALTVVAGVLTGKWLPVILTVAEGFLMAGSFYAVAVKFGPNGIGKLLLAGPAYLLGKLPLLAGFVFRRERKWVRTERDPPQPPD